jgi:hypothetical protein
MAVVRRVRVPSRDELIRLVKRIEKRWQKGRGYSCREMNDLRVANWICGFSGEVYDDLPSTQELVDNRSADPRCAIFRKVASSEDNLASRILSASLFAVTNSSLLCTDTPNYFVLSDSLAAMLQATELRGVYPDDIHLPMPGFFIQIPTGCFDWYNDITGYHPVEIIGVAEQNKGSCPHDQRMLSQGHRLLVSIFGSPNAASTSPLDDGCGSFTIPLHTANRDISEMAAEDEIESSLEFQGGRIHGHEVSGKEIREAIRNFTLNLILYISAYRDCDVVHAHEEKVQSILRQRKTKGKNFAKRRLHELQEDRTFLVGTKVVFGREAPGMPSGTGQERSAQTFRSLVRGHWRRQAHGPERALRKMIWIQPHSRGGDAGAVFGHDYVIR